MPCTSAGGRFQFRLRLYDTPVSSQTGETRAAKPAASPQARDQITQRILERIGPPDVAEVEAAS